VALHGKNERERKGTYMPDVEDVKQPEETGSESSAEIKSTIEELNASEGDKTQEGTISEDEKGIEPMIPKKRFDEVNSKMKAYQELLEVQEKSSTPKESKEEEKSDKESKENIPVNNESRMREIARQEMSSKDKELSSAVELNSVMSANPDFVNYKDSIKAIIQSNPTVSWSNAYKIAKFDSGEVVDTKQSTPDKSAAIVESSQASPKTGDIGDLDPLAKDPSGKFLYSTKELEKVLPKK